MHSSRIHLSLRLGLRGRRCFNGSDDPSVEIEGPLVPFLIFLKHVIFPLFSLEHGFDISNNIFLSCFLKIQDIFKASAPKTISVYNCTGFTDILLEEV